MDCKGNKVAKNKKKNGVCKPVKRNKTPHPFRTYLMARQLLIMALLVMEALAILTTGELGLTHPTRYTLSVAKKNLGIYAMSTSLILNSVYYLIHGNPRLTYINYYPLSYMLKLYLILYNGLITEAEKELSMSWKIKGSRATFRCEKCKNRFKHRWCIIKNFNFRHRDINPINIYIGGRGEHYGPNNGRALSTDRLHKYCTACGSYLGVTVTRL